MPLLGRENVRHATLLFRVEGVNVQAKRAWKESEKYMFICCVSSQLSVASFALSVVGIIVSVVAIWVSHLTSKRYASGIIDIVFTALDPMLLEKVAKTLSKVSSDDCPGNINLNLHMREQDNEYEMVWQVFFNLNMLAELMSDDALPTRINECARHSIRNYLSRKQVRTFVNENKVMLHALYEIGGLKD